MQLSKLLLSEQDAQEHGFLGTRSWAKTAWTPAQQNANSGLVASLPSTEQAAEARVGVVPASTACVQDASRMDSIDHASTGLAQRSRLEQSVQIEPVITLTSKTGRKRGLTELERLQYDYFAVREGIQLKDAFTNVCDRAKAASRARQAPSRVPVTLTAHLPLKQKAQMKLVASASVPVLDAETLEQLTIRKKSPSPVVHTTSPVVVTAVAKPVSASTTASSMGSLKPHKISASRKASHGIAKVASRKKGRRKPFNSANDRNDYDDDDSAVDTAIRGRSKLAASLRRSCSPTSSIASSAMSTNSFRSGFSSRPAPRKRARAFWGRPGSDFDDDVLTTTTPASRARTPLTSAHPSDDEAARRSATPGILVKRPVAALEDYCSIDADLWHSKRLVDSHSHLYTQNLQDPQNPRAPVFSWFGAERPVVRLEYPARGASEEFVLVPPKRDGEEYSPLVDLVEVIELVLKYYLTPDQAVDAFYIEPVRIGDSVELVSRSETPPPLSDALETETILPRRESFAEKLRNAEERRDGPALLGLIGEYNRALVELKQDGHLRKQIMGMQGVEYELCCKISDQCYERRVGPESHTLRRALGFSSYTYGELHAPVLRDIFAVTDLGPGQVFVDLGSGVGNTLIQSAISTGCDAYGFEYVENTARLAKGNVEEALRRIPMWGLRAGQIKTYKADIRQNDLIEDPSIEGGQLRISDILQRADVILVNNYIFSAELNDTLKLRFLELKDGAQIVSLKPFVSADFVISDRNNGSPEAILRWTGEYAYNADNVSWAGSQGTFTVAKVDRGPVQAFNARQPKRASRKPGFSSPLVAAGSRTPVPNSSKLKPSSTDHAEGLGQKMVELTDDDAVQQLAT
ncbi:hypothetical protein E5Q_05528 [Mixia osmundae IAM 14324]|uniref:Histone-lysine N-methyltransferase, H3 lysine-79 specific n=1 Tax=Mixia osmundae (strain CBS 9802 / IAM 14324 / JCM 22182 / KY 12970) TaxID=764103 RepID=G7E7N0_MIXOS|nr:hypothetical protein E5Q_05528 [Mixia osmundae IAM 14324]